MVSNKEIKQKLEAKKKGEYKITEVKESALEKQKNICPFCNLENPSNAKYCMGCGKKLATPTLNKSSYIISDSGININNIEKPYKPVTDKKIYDHVKRLIKDLKSSNQHIREQAADKFWQESYPSVFGVDGKPLHMDGIRNFREVSRKVALDSIITTLLNDNSRLVRVSLSWCLGDLNDSRGVEPLIKCLNNKDSGIRGACVINLVKLKKFSFKPLLEALNSNNEYIRRESVQALGEIKNKDAVGPLIELLVDTEWNVRFKTIVALGKIGDKKALIPITACLDDKSANVRRKAAEVLGKLSAGATLPTDQELLGNNKQFY